jgi:hypothetical protein
MKLEIAYWNGAYGSLVEEWFSRPEIHKYGPVQRSGSKG